MKVSIVPWIVKKLKSCFAIVEDGNTASQNIAQGKYVIWKGNMCKASSLIVEGTTLSGSNLTAVSDGALNELKFLFRGAIFNDSDLNDIQDGIYYLASTLPAHAPSGFNWSILFQTTAAGSMIHQYIFKPVSGDIMLREYSGDPVHWTEWVNTTSYGASWGTSFTCYAKYNVVALYVNSNIRIQIFLGGTTDIAVSVEVIGNSSITSFTKSGTNSITFGETSSSGDDYTITRNGKMITVTRKSNAAMVCKC